MSEHLLGALAVWLLWILAEHLLEAPKWLWYLLVIAAGIGWELLLDPSEWWVGVGVGGAAAFVYLLADLTIVVTDLAKVHVLRISRK